MTFWGRLSKLLSVFPKRSAKKPPSLQVPVVQKVDSTIHWINHYPLDNAIGWRYPTFEQPVPDFDWRRRKTQNPKTFFDSDKPFPNKIWRSTPEHLFTCKIVRMPSPIVHTQYFIFIFFFFVCMLYNWIIYSFFPNYLFGRYLVWVHIVSFVLASSGHYKDFFLLVSFSIFFLLFCKTFVSNFL